VEEGGGEGGGGGERAALALTFSLHCVSAEPGVCLIQVLDIL